MPLGKRETNIHRKIYIENFGKIPLDEEGRTFEIHHIDGDFTNNDPSNLKAVSVQEHFQIHLGQEDWGACFKIAERMKISPEEKSDLARKAANKMVEEGSHPWLGGKWNTIHKKGKPNLGVSLARKGKPPPNKGRPMSDETKAKLSQATKGKPKPAVSIALRGRKSSKEQIEKRLIKMVGRSWFNDGQRETLLHSCPEGWSKGRLLCR